MPLRVLIFLCCLLAASLACAIEPALLTEADVDRASAKLRAFLYSRQEITPRGTRRGWDHAFSSLTAHSGPTALVASALLASGDSPQRPQLAAALVYLRSTPPQGVYQVSFRCHVWSTLPAAYLPLLRSDAAWLQQHARADASFGYPGDQLTAEAIAYYDNSNTHYGMLGLWEAAKRDIDIPTDFWSRSLRHWLADRQPDGGWTYQRFPNDSPRPSTGSMTVAGLASLIIAKAQLQSAGQPLPPDTDPAIAAALAWLDANFTAERNPRGSWPYYYYLGLERAASASGRRLFARQDWYRLIAAKIVTDVDRDGSVNTNSVVDSALALLFLSHGKAPVWATLLQLPAGAPLPPPLDLPTLTRRLSDYRETRLHWQTLDLSAPPFPDDGDLLSAPVLFLPLSAPPALTPEQITAIRRCLDRGALLVLCPAAPDPAVSAALPALALQLAPEGRLEPAPAAHPLLSIQEHIAPDPAAPISILSMGPRARVIILSAPPSWPLAVNLFTWATNRGQLPAKIALPPEVRQNRPILGSVAIQPLTLNKQPFPEPLVWERAAVPIFNRTGLNVEALPPISLDDLANPSTPFPPLAHLAGWEKVVLSPAQLAAINAYLSRGGTLLIESIAGNNPFAVALEAQLAASLRTAPIPLSDLPDLPLLTGQNLPPGAHDLRGQARYRLSTLARFPSPPLQSRLTVLMHQNRPAVIISAEDISLGVLQVPHADIDGYAPATARAILTNVVLSVSK